MSDKKSKPTDPPTGGAVSGQAEWNLSYTDFRMAACLCSANERGLASLILSHKDGEAIAKDIAQDPHRLTHYLPFVAAMQRLTFDWPADGPKLDFFDVSTHETEARGDFIITPDTVYLPWPLALTDIHDDTQDDSEDRVPDDFDEKTRELKQKGLDFSGRKLPDLSKTPFLQFVENLDIAIDDMAQLVRYKQQDRPEWLWRQRIRRFYKNPGESLDADRIDTGFHGGTTIHIAPPKDDSAKWRILFPTNWKSASGDPLPIEWPNKPLGIAATIPNSPDISILDFTATCHAFWNEPPE